MAATAEPIQSSIALPAIMDVAVCAGLVVQLQDELAAKPKVGVDASAIERVSTPGVQLLMSAIKTAENDGKRVVIRFASPTLMQAINDLGLAQHFHPYLDNRKAPQ